MAKRFIDTELFEDEWFMDLSKDGKVFWIYCLTKCDHAGILELNKKLCKFQTGIKDLESVIKELGNRLATLEEPYIFIPKFLFFQYPNFPNSNVKAQQSAINKLLNFELLDKGSLTLRQGLVNNYGTDNGNGNDSEKGDSKGGMGKEGQSYLSDEVLGEFKETWLDYLEHRKELKVKGYASEKSEGIKFKELKDMAGNSPEIAQKIVDQSRSNQWQGLFPLKENTANGKKKEASNDSEMIEYLYSKRKKENVDLAIQKRGIERVYKDVKENNMIIDKHGELILL